MAYTLTQATQNGPSYDLIKGLMLPMRQGTKPVAFVSVLQKIWAFKVLAVFGHVILWPTSRAVCCESGQVLLERFVGHDERKKFPQFSSPSASRRSRYLRF